MFPPTVESISLELTYMIHQLRDIDTQTNRVPVHIERAEKPRLDAAATFSKTRQVALATAEEQTQGKWA